MHELCLNKAVTKKSDCRTITYLREQKSHEPPVFSFVSGEANPHRINLKEAVGPNKKIAVFVHHTTRYTLSCLKCFSKLPGTENCQDQVLIG